MITKRVFLALMIAAFCFTILLWFSQGGAVASPSPDASARPVLAAPAAPNKVYLPLLLKNNNRSSLWRFGVARARRPFSDYQTADVMAMRFGWYVDFFVSSNNAQAYGMEYVPTVRVKQLKDGVTPPNAPCNTCSYTNPYSFTISPGVDALRSLAAAWPGTTWLIGNEIERRDWGTCSTCGQDEILPEVYVQAYHDAYAAIKAGDPSAKVAIGSMVEATPLRLKYLDRVWSAYTNTYHITMPVDLWNIHAYVLWESPFGQGIPAGLTGNEAVPQTWPTWDEAVVANQDFTYVQNDVIRLRNWMKQNGQQGKPLIITEYGVLYSPYWCTLYVCPPGSLTPPAVRDHMMYPSFDYFMTTGISSTIGFPQDGYRLVQRWNWYSMDDDANNGTYQYFNGNLFYSGYESNPLGIAPLGTYWSAYVQPLPPGSNPPY